MGTCIYSQHIYEKQIAVFCNTMQILRKVPGGSVPNPSTIRRQAKRFKEIGSVKNRKVNHRRHVLTEETLDEIGKRLEHTPKNL